MEYYKEILASGLRVIIIPMPSLASATVSIYVGVGSRHEENKVNGISHFLEHMVFKGSKKYPSAKRVSEAVDAIGGEFNAATSKEWTKFYIRAHAKSLPTACSVLSDIVYRPLLKTADIEREKGVIVEEIAMYDDTPTQKVREIFEQLMFEGHPLARDIAGTKEIVRNITKNDFETYRKIHYYPENMLLVIAGGVTRSGAIKLAKKYFASSLTKAPKTFKSQKYINNQTAPKAMVLNQKREQAHYVLGFLGYPTGHKDRYAEAVLDVLLGSGMSSRFFTEIREKRGLCYYVGSDSEHFADTGYFTGYAGVELSKAKEAISIMLKEFYKLGGSKHGITKKEIEKAKEYLKGHISLGLENTRAVADFFGYEELLLKKVRTPEEVFKAIDLVTIDDITRIAKKIFRKEFVNLAIIGPYDDSSQFEKLLK